MLSTYGLVDGNIEVAIFTRIGQSQSYSTWARLTCYLLTNLNIFNTLFRYILITNFVFKHIINYLLISIIILYIRILIVKIQIIIIFNINYTKFSFIWVHELVKLGLILGSNSFKFSLIEAISKHISSSSRAAKLIYIATVVYIASQFVLNGRIKILLQKKHAKFDKTCHKSPRMYISLVQVGLFKIVM